METVNCGGCKYTAFDLIDFVCVRKSHFGNTAVCVGFFSGIFYNFKNNNHTGIRAT